MDPITLILMQAAAAGINAVGSFYDAKTQKYGLESRALADEFQAGQSSINARQAEQDAQRILAAGRRRVGLLGLQQAERAGARSAATAAGNVAAGVGSAGEAAASERFAYEIDTREVSLATVGAAGSARTEAQNQRNQTLFAQTEARAFRRSAGKISPWLTAVRTGVGGAGKVAGDWFSFYQMGGS